MENMLWKEKKFLKPGETCAIELKNIYSASISDNYPYDEMARFTFYGNHKCPMSTGDEITFMKYLGNGLFVDLVTDSLFMTGVYIHDYIGTDEYNALDEESKREIMRAEDTWEGLHEANDLNDLNEGLNFFMSNPLIIDYADYFISITPDVTKRFGSQDFKQLKEKILSSKLSAQEALKKKYSEIVNRVNEEHLNTR